ncbi:hypothetical protein JHK85_046515 [Glycine max]|nr:hypothetical protein JHK87_045739 [Glycine soja]KAG4952648.1 hypothetical protein JHK85_046515 [Glycine max]
MIARQVSYLLQSHLPFLQLLRVMLEPPLRLCQCFSITTFLVSHIGRIHLIKDRSIVFREHGDGNSGLLNCLHKCWCYLLPSLKLLIINESVDSLALKSVVEMASKSMTCVFPSEDEEHIVIGGRGT